MGGIKVTSSYRNSTLLMRSGSFMMKKMIWDELLVTWARTSQINGFNFRHECRKLSYLGGPPCSYIVQCKDFAMSAPSRSRSRERTICWNHWQSWNSINTSRLVKRNVPRKWLWHQKIIFCCFPINVFRNENLNQPNLPCKTCGNPEDSIWKEQPWESTADCASAGCRTRGGVFCKWSVWEC